LLTRGIFERFATPHMELVGIEGCGIQHGTFAPRFAP
jgi:hypothetical protein